MTKLDLNSSEFDDYYFRYIDKLSNKTELRKGFETGKITIINFFESIPKKKLTHRYQPEKWSIKEILQHLIDTERIFMYRCFRIARQDKTALAGYDQDDYIAPSGADEKTIANLLNEFTTNRNHSISLLNSLTDQNLAFVGNSSGSAMSARAAAFTIIGHDIWHMETIQNKYL
ncbi:DinB family protein [Aureibaculum sp. A20]|uniref:DinB family protein n=1 Tax=Aureibaculum flavum TaxID=2795986 RepID=A0ABS0WM57_9FLAO|nr:DinB family protein [Aureibaculum flavum]MBJ2173050.1 DinB family protein [Aureibaculum flavum]